MMAQLLVQVLLSINLIKAENKVIENQTQLTADQQHQVETFGELDTEKSVKPIPDINPQLAARHFQNDCTCYGCMAARKVIGSE